MDPAEALTRAQSSAEDFIKSAEAELTRTTDAFFKSQYEKLLAKVRDQVRHQASEWIRGPHLFEEPEKRIECEWGGTIVPFPDEHIVVVWRSGCAFTYDTTCSNYGRMVGPTATLTCKAVQIRPPGDRLTAEVVEYIADLDSKSACKLLNTYNKKGYAFAYNSIRETKEKAIRSQIKRSLAGEFKKLAEEQLRLETLAKGVEEGTEQLRIAQEEFAQEVARKKARRQHKQALDDSKREIILLRKQAARALADANTKSEMPGQDRAQWESHCKKLADCVAALRDESN
jgi:hypothetical protein